MIGNVHTFTITGTQAGISFDSTTPSRAGKPGRKDRIMGEHQKELLEYIMTLTPEQADKVLQHLPELRAAIADEEKAAS